MVSLLTDSSSEIKDELFLLTAIMVGFEFAPYRQTKEQKTFESKESTICAWPSFSRPLFSPRVLIGQKHAFNPEKQRTWSKRNRTWSKRCDVSATCFWIADKISERVPRMLWISLQGKNHRFSLRYKASCGSRNVVESCVQLSMFVSGQTQEIPTRLSKGREGV